MSAIIVGHRGEAAHALLDADTRGRSVIFTGVGHGHPVRESSGRQAQQGQPSAELGLPCERASIRPRSTRGRRPGVRRAIHRKAGNRRLRVRVPADAQKVRTRTGRDLVR